MAKTKLTSSQRSINNCFIESREKVCSETFVEKYNIGTEDEEGSVESDVNSTISVVENKNCQTSGNYERIYNEQRSSNDTEQSGQTEILQELNLREKESQDETADDDKSDYGAESFCSDGSFKGSEITNVTARSSMSGCSSLFNFIGDKYEKRRTSVIQNRIKGGRYATEEDRGLSTPESEMKNFGEEETLVMDRRHLTRSGRRNMSFTNDELRKIERENQLLLRKIMSHQKPPVKTSKPINGPPRTSSSAINRKRQQQKIEEDNMVYYWFGFWLF